MAAVTDPAIATRQIVETSTAFSSR